MAVDLCLHLIPFTVTRPAKGAGALDTCGSKVPTCH